MSDLFLRPAEECDKDWILSVYNDPEVRWASGKPREHRVSIEEHHAWWTANMADPAERVYIALVTGHRVGVGRLSRVGQPVVEVSLYLSADWRNRGFGFDLLTQLVDAATKQGAIGITARTYPYNWRSMRLFAERGFKCELVRWQKSLTT